jgi:hypothetical protein
MSDPSKDSDIKEKMKLMKLTDSSENQEIEIIRKIIMDGLK